MLYTHKATGATVFIVEMHARCQSCSYALGIESVSKTSAASKLGNALMEHALEFPTHVINLSSSKPDCTLEEHLDATSTAVPCKCQVS